MVPNIQETVQKFRGAVRPRIPTMNIQVTSSGKSMAESFFVDDIIHSGFEQLASPPAPETIAPRCACLTLQRIQPQGVGQLFNRGEKTHSLLVTQPPLRVEENTGQLALPNGSIGYRSDPGGISAGVSPYPRC